jgi:hypothetical protein
MTKDNKKDDTIALYCDIETREILDINDSVTQISSDIAQAIAEHSEFNLESLYDLIMNNPVVASKEDLLFLLKAIVKPKQLRASQVERKSVRAGLKTFMGFNNVEFQKDEDGETVGVIPLNKSNKKLILEWLDLLKPGNNLERSLKTQYLASKKVLEQGEGEVSQAECFREIYNRVKKDVLNKR